MKPRLVLLLMAGLLVAACGSGRAATPPPAHPNFAGLAKRVGCPLPPGHTSDLAVLGDLHPVLAVRCAEGQRIYPGHGQWLAPFRTPANDPEVRAP
ncbi:MAG TPA: hypothetical protein VKR79_07140 [Gaiellaceae bacterium]|nr:hypothetical protein [Gaiellaceae bacterium]